MGYGTCKICGCTDYNCLQCLEATGVPCSWVDDDHEMCTRCLVEEMQQPIVAEAICNQCGTNKENWKTGFCINGHDDWLEIEDTEAINQFAIRNNIPFQDVIAAIINNTEITLTADQKLKNLWNEKGKDKNESNG